MVLKDLLTPQKVLHESEAFMDLDLSSCESFHNPFEERYICSDSKRITGPVLGILEEINSKTFLQMLENIIGVKELIPDPSFLTAGMHLTKRKSIIDVHLDYNIHLSY